MWWQRSFQPSLLAPLLSKASEFDMEAYSPSLPGPRVRLQDTEWGSVQRNPVDLPQPIRSSHGMQLWRMRIQCA